MSEINFIMKDTPTISNHRIRGKLPVLEWWSPEKYLLEIYSPNPNPKRCVEKFLSDVAEKLEIDKQHVVEQLRRQEPTEPLFLIYFRVHQSAPKMVHHDGMHRAAACIKLGIKKIPVYVWR